MSPIISPSGRRVCYGCGKKTEVLATVELGTVSCAELCSDCLGNMTCKMIEKEEEIENERKREEAEHDVRDRLEQFRKTL